MNEDLLFLLKHRGRGALLDANLLLVYVVGKTHPDRLSTLHHTKQYERDFPLIKRVVEFFPTIYTTPNVLTEVSNLGRKLGVDFFNTLRSVIAVLEERYCTSKDASADKHFLKLGLTDAGLCSVAAKHLVITADFALYQILRTNKMDAVNINHLRQIAWKGAMPSLQ
jgi:hypothetical protein